jgi:hypothetical protein
MNHTFKVGDTVRWVSGYKYQIGRIGTVIELSTYYPDCVRVRWGDKGSNRVVHTSNLTLHEQTSDEKRGGGVPGEAVPG